MSSTGLGVQIVVTGAGFGTVAASFGTLGERVSKLDAIAERSRQRMAALGLDTIKAFAAQKHVAEDAKRAAQQQALATTELGRSLAQARQAQEASTAALAAHQALLKSQTAKPTADQTEQLKKLRLESHANEKATRQLAREFDAARQRGQGLTEEAQRQTLKLIRLRDELHANGVATQRLTSNGQGLAATIAKRTRLFEAEERAMARVTARAQRLKDVQADIDKHKGELSERRSNLYAAAGMAASVAVPVVVSAKFEDKVKQISITGELYKEAGAEDALSRAIRAAAIAHGVSHDNVAGGVERLVAQGMDAKKAQEFAPLLARTAKATRTDMGELAELVYTLQTKFKLNSEAEVLGGLNALAKAGKLGSYELKQMARAFPELGGAAASFGSTGLAGVKEMGAMMQLMRAGSGTTGEADTYMRNWFSHMSAKTTQDHFEKVGINFEQAKLAKMLNQRVSAVEASFMVFDDYLSKVTASGFVEIKDKKGRVKERLDVRAELRKASEIARKEGLQGEALQQRVQAAVQRMGLSTVLQDIQATQAYLAYVNGKDKYQNTRKALDSADTAQTIARDEAEQAKLATQQWEALKTQVTDLGILVGGQLTPAVGDVLSGLTRLASWLNRFGKEHEGTVKAMAVTGSVAAVGVASVLTLGAAASLAKLGLAGFRSIPYLGRIAGTPGSFKRATERLRSTLIKETKWVKPTDPPKPGGAPPSAKPPGPSSGGGAGAGLGRWWRSFTSRWTNTKTAAAAAPATAAKLPPVVSTVVTRPSQAAAPIVNVKPSVAPNGLPNMLRAAPVPAAVAVPMTAARNVAPTITLRPTVLPSSLRVAPAVAATAPRAATPLTSTAAKVTQAVGHGVAKLKPLGAAASKLATPLSVGMALYSAGSAVANERLDRGSKGQAVGSAAGGLAGGLAGAKLGAMVGTVILPGVGTLAGSLLGGLAGSLAGDWLGGKLGRNMASKPSAPPPAPVAVPKVAAPAKPTTPKVDIKLDYKPSVTIHGDPTPQGLARFGDMLRQHQATLEQMLRRVMDEQQRRALR